jgi:hypothetical protein
LKLPSYPHLARLAGLGLTAITAVAINADGSPHSVSFEEVSGSPADLDLFRPTIEQAMRESLFDAQCGGKTVRLRLSFKINLDGRPQAVYFMFPDRFEIEGEAPILNTSPK